jgi:hypothetical protein
MGTQKYGAFCVSFMLNASLSHFCGDFPFLGVRQILQLICSEEQLF